MNCNKKRGFALFATVLSIGVLLLVSGGFFTIMASNTGMVKSSGESLQAQYFAQLEADTIKLVDYDDISNITQNKWINFDVDSNWQYKVNVGSEKTIGDDNKMRIATVAVRKKGDTIDRYTLDVPLSSQDSGGSRDMITGVAKHGAILPIPKGAKRENCIYIVDLHHWTGTGSDNKYTYDMYIWVDRATGKLTCYTVTSGRDGTGGAYAGYANYTVINTGKKVDYQGIS